jgi:hypothetical protein
MQDGHPGHSAQALGDDPRPLVARGSRGSTDVIHENLRVKILSGVIAPGSELSQAQVAKDFGIDIVLTRWRACPRTHASIAKRRAEGKSDNEIRRLLKRYIAREMFRALNTAIAA